MGGLCMISYPLFLYKYFNADKNMKWIILFLLLSTAALHLLTGSRTTLLSSAIGIFVLFFIARRRFSIVFLVVVVTLAAITLTVYKPSLLTRGGSLSKFSGRLSIWAASVEMMHEKPLLGYGYGVGGAIFDDPRFYDEELFLWQGSTRVSLHSGYFSVAVGAGLIGFAIFFLALLLPFGKSITILDAEMKALMTSTLIMCLITNFMESFIGGPSSIGALVLWTFWGIAGQKYRTFNAHTFS
jgi:O-antigen ligase